MSWVSLSGSDGCDSGKNSYKEVAKQAFASPSNLSSRLGNRTPSRDGPGLTASESFSNPSRRAPSSITPKDKAEAFLQIFNSTSVQLSKKHNIPRECNSGELGEGLRALARRASRQYHTELNSTDAEASCSISNGKESFSIGSVSRRTKDLDLAHNDNSFHVIGGLIVEFFQTKQMSGNCNMRLTPQDIAQLDRLAPPRVRASFVEAVRYRFTNAPMGSTSSVHQLARQCHDLGLDAEGPQNPLLVAAETEIVITVPRVSSIHHGKTQGLTSANYSGQESSSETESSGGVESVTPSGSTSPHTSYFLAHRKSDPGAADSKTPVSCFVHRKADPGASGSRAPVSSIPPPGSSASSFLTSIGQPLRHQNREDPPAASVSTRLTKLGVEVPFGPEADSVENMSSSDGGSHSQGSSEHKPDPSEGSFHRGMTNIQEGANSARTSASLMKFGMEMPRYEDSVSSLHGGGVSVLTDAKSMVTSLTRLGVEMPLAALHHEGGSMTSGQSESDASHSCHLQSHESADQACPPLVPAAAAAAALAAVAAATGRPAAHQQTKMQPEFMERLIVAPILSLSSDKGSFLLQTESSKEYNTEVSLAKQQLLAELQEASNLMSESKTQEAAKFWRDHVLELEARLRALNGEEASVMSALNKATDKSVSVTAPETSLASVAGMSVAAPSVAGSLAAQWATSMTNSIAVNTFTTADSATQPAASSKGAVKSISAWNTLPAQNPSPRGAAGADSIQQRNSGQMNTMQLEDAANYKTDASRAPLTIDPSLEGVPLVDVVAPADLPGGYHFEAEIEGRRFLATVPAGGVQKGETFSSYMRDLEKVGSDIPVGRWRDGLFDCCSIGCCHPVICNALCCPLAILGQIMTRVGFDFLGRPSRDNGINGPNTLFSILCFWVFVNLALFSAYNFKWSQGMELSMADLGALAFVNVSYLLFVVYLASATRGSLREKYYIRESRFHDLEDCCCATFCLPCTVCQMARHTADYEEYEGVCCNDTGLPDAYESPTEQARSRTYQHMV